MIDRQAGFDERPQLDPGLLAYNLPFAHRLIGPLDVTALERAFNEVIRRHEILRTSLAVRSGQPVQVVAPFQAAPPSLITTSIRNPLSTAGSGGGAGLATTFFGASLTAATTFVSAAFNSLAFWAERNRPPVFSARRRRPSYSCLVTSKPTTCVVKSTPCSSSSVPSAHGSA